MTDGQPPTFEWLRDRMEAYTLRTDLKNHRDKQELELRGTHAAPAKTAPDDSKKKQKKKKNNNT